MEKTQEMLANRLFAINEEIITLICTGEGSVKDGDEYLKFSAGTIQKINDNLTRRNEIITLLNELNSEKVEETPE